LVLASIRAADSSVPIQSSLRCELRFICFAEDKKSVELAKTSWRQYYVGIFTAMTEGKTFLLAGALAFLVVFAVHFLNFPGSVPRFQELSVGGTLMDQTPSFNTEEIYQRLTDE